MIDLLADRPPHGGYCATPPHPVGHCVDCNRKTRLHVRYRTCPACTYQRLRLEDLRR